MALFLLPCGAERTGGAMVQNGCVVGVGRPVVRRLWLNRWRDGYPGFRVAWRYRARRRYWGHRVSWADERRVRVVARCFWSWCDRR